LLETIDHLMTEFLAYTKDFVPEAVDSRIVSRFAIVYAGGRLAQRYGILPKVCHVRAAAKSCLKAALAVDADVHAGGEKELAATAAKLIELAKGPNTIRVRKGAAKQSRRSCREAVAFLCRKKGGHRELRVRGEAFRRLFSPNHKEMAIHLKQVGLLVPSKTRSLTRQERVPNYAGEKENFYCFNYAKLKEICR